jgi:DNA-directed RNA polymerase subunit E'/Rpb7
VLEGSDLKPVDDILVTEDGTLYAACQFQVVIWKPD